MLALLCIAILSRNSCQVGEDARRRPYRRRRSVTVTCRPCPAGQYGAAPGICQLCPSGQWQAAEGQAECNGVNLCPAGRYGSLGATAPPEPCRLCPAGQVQWHTGRGACLPCPAGTFVTTDGGSLCHGTPCPAGTRGVTGRSTPPVNRSKCTACAPGQASALPGLAQCTPCPAGQWQPQSGMSGCLHKVRCGNYAYWQAGLCHPEHPYVFPLLIASWSGFALTLVNACCWPGPDTRWGRGILTVSFFVTLACGIMTSPTQRRHPMSEAYAYCLVGVLSLVGVLLLTHMSRILLTQRQE